LWKIPVRLALSTLEVDPFGGWRYLDGIDVVGWPSSQPVLKTP